MGAAARFAAALGLGFLAKVLLSILAGPPVGSVLAGALAGYIASGSPYRGFAAAAISSLAGWALVAALAAWLGYVAAGPVGFITAASIGTGLMFIGVVDATIAGLAGAVAAGLRVTHGHGSPP